MSIRWMQRGLVASLVLVGLVTGRPGKLWGQGRPPANQPVGRERLKSPDLRVPAAEIRLDAILRDWAAASGKINRLQGTHKRWTYDKVFGVAKEAEGKFFYEAPDKGRIDIEPAEIPKDKPDVERHGEQYRREPDSPERWICNGREIHQIEVAEKMCRVIPIPPEQRGEHIMDGPLPFLFGMPPDEAKRRYSLKLVKEDANKIWLFIEPMRQQDRANWKNAAVILTKDNYLPEAVRLVDPAGQRETVFAFDHGSLKINKRSTIFSGDPFKPLLIGYDVHIERPMEPPRQGITNAGLSPSVPSGVGLHWKDASIIMRRAGYEVELKGGSPATRRNMVDRVEAQDPKPGAQPNGERKVVLTVYLKSQTAEKVQPNPNQDRQTAKPPEPRRTTQQ